MDLKTLKAPKTVATIGKALNINPKIVLAILEIMISQKIAKPEKIFKEGLAKLNAPTKHDFTFINLGNKSYLLPGAKLPLGNEQAKSLSFVQKKLKKAKKDAEKIELEQQIFFLQELAKINPKGFAIGTMYFSKKTRTKNGQKEYLMAVKNGVEVGGNIKKGNLAEAVNNIPYNLVAKNGERMAFNAVEKDTDNTSEPSAKANKTTASTDLDKIVTVAKTAFATFKNDLLPAINNKTLSEKQQQQLQQVSKDFETFNQAINNASKEKKAANQSLIDAIQNVAAFILKVQAGPQQTDIINNDNVFSKEEKIAIKHLVKLIKKGLPLVKKQVIPNLKTNASTPADQTILSDLIDNITRFNDNFDAAPDPVKMKLSTFHSTVSKQQEQLQTILQKLEGKAAQQLNKMLTPEQRREIMNEVQSEINQILEELSNLKPTA